MRLCCVSVETHELYHFKLTNSIIWVPRTLSSKYHQLYHLASLLFSRVSIQAPLCVYRGPRTLSSHFHTNSVMHASPMLPSIYHLIPTNSIIWVPRTLSSQSHTNSVIQTSQTLPSRYLSMRRYVFVEAHELYHLRPTNSIISLSHQLCHPNITNSTI